MEHNTLIEKVRQSTILVTAQTIMLCVFFVKNGVPVFVKARDYA